METTVAVFDVGKTNLKLSVIDAEGRTRETRSAPNAVLPAHAPGPGTGPWRRHDLEGSERWLLASLAQLCARWEVAAFICCGHGSSGVLVAADELSAPAPRLPMIDYEQDVPAHIDGPFRDQTGGFRDRGAAIMHGATHASRQTLWAELDAPESFARAQAWLGVPQYWAWRLSGGMASEITYLAAQSDLWNSSEARPSTIVRHRGWARLLPPRRHAGDDLGAVRPDLARRHRLPADLRVLTGLHDSSANLFRYQASGLSPLAVLSTGTWLVALSDHADLDALDPGRGMTITADPDGRLLGGALTMGGREFAAVAGPAEGTADADIVRALVSRGTMALPSFGNGDGLFPGSAGRGRIAGPPPASDAERRALAVLYTALLSAECLAAVGSRGQVMLDGSFTRDPVYCRLVAALLDGRQVARSTAPDGPAVGAALLAMPGATVPPPEPCAPLSVPGLDTYRDRWRARAATPTDTATG